MSRDPAVAPRVPRWKLERMLIDALADPFLEHDTAMIAIAAAFGAPGCAARLWEWLDETARPLFTVGHELARRARWPSLVATPANQHVTVLTDEEYFAPIAPPQRPGLSRGCR